jgi:hypothetical protein
VYFFSRSFSSLPCSSLLSSDQLRGPLLPPSSPPPPPPNALLLPPVLGTW